MSLLSARAQGLAESSHAGKSNDERGAPAARLPETIVVVAGLDKGNLGSADTPTGSSSGHGETREKAAEAQLGEEVRWANATLRQRQQTARASEWQHIKL